MKSRGKFIIYAVSIIVFVTLYFFFRQMQYEYESITTFQECLEAGYPMIATYPEQCKIPGKTFTNPTQIASIDTIDATTTVKASSYKNASYSIGGKRITLKNGRYTGDHPLSHEDIQYFGNEVRGDFDDTGTEDIAFLITRTGDASSTLFYITVALSDSNRKYSGTNAILLGDRIAPQTTELRNGEIIVNYADRPDGEPMTTRPTLALSRHFKVLKASLVEVTE